MTKLFLEKMKKLREHGVREKIPNISDVLGKFLNLLIKTKNVKSILEIGTCNGYSTLWMAEALKKNKNNNKIITYEISIPGFNEAQINFKKFKLSKYIDSRFEDFLKIDARKLSRINLAPTKINYFDLIFIDAQKNKTLKFFNVCKQLITNDGIIIIDDVIKFKYKMSDFYKYIEKQKQFEYVVMPIDIDDGIMILIKK